MSPDSLWFFLGFLRNIHHHFVLLSNQHIFIIHLHIAWAMRVAHIEEHKSLSLNIRSQIFSWIGWKNIELINKGYHLVLFGLLDMLHLSIKNHTFLLVDYDDVVTHLYHVMELQGRVQFITEFFSILTINIEPPQTYLFISSFFLTHSTNAYFVRITVSQEN